MTVGELAGLGAIHADAVSTGGAYELFEAPTPKGFGPPMHVHRDREEAFYVVSGQFTVVCDDREIEAGPGQFVMVRRGSWHRYEACSDEARLIFIVSPPGLEEFFRDGAELRASGLADMEVRRELAKRYDSHPVGPSEEGSSAREAEQRCSSIIRSDPPGGGSPSTGRRVSDEGYPLLLVPRRFSWLLWS